MTLRFLIVALLIGVTSQLRSETAPLVMPDDTLDLQLVTSFSNGGNTVCLDIVVSGFDSVNNFTFTLRWNPDVLSYRGPFIFEFGSGDIPLQEETSILFNDANTDRGYFTLSWDIPEVTDSALSLPDGTSILRFCFDITGDPCTSSPIWLADNPTPLEFSQENGIIWSSEDLVSFSDSILIEGTGLAIFDRSCNASPGNSDGVINFYPCGGQEPYTWTLDGVPQTATLREGLETQIDGLARGQYRIIVTDANGVTAERVVIIDEGNLIDFDLVPRDPNCFYRNNGRMAVENITGGFGPYLVQWSNSEYDTEVINSLSVGTYTASVTDVLGCTVFKSESLSTDTLKAVVTRIDSAGCGGQTGIVEVIASGGQPIAPPDIYNYNGTFSNRFRAPFPAGQHSITITDEVGCEIEVDFVVPTRDSFDVSIMTTDISCFDEYGTLSAIADGPFQFTFELLNLDGSAVDFFAGTSTVNTYSNDSIPVNTTTNQDTYILVTTTVQFGCTKSDTLQFNRAEPVSVDGSVTNPGCSQTNGSIDLTITGGTAPYTFVWDDATTDEDRIDIPPATYLVTVTDIAGCTGTGSYTISPGGSIIVNPAVVQAIDCAGGDNGMLTANPSPADDYSYAWSTTLGGTVLSQDQLIMNLAAGWYYVTVSSNTEVCEGVDSIFILDGSPLTFDILPTSPTCANINDGRIGIAVTSGVAPYEYEWADDPDNDLSKSLLAGLAGGQYAVTISDSRGCSIDTLITLFSPLPVFVTIDNLLDPDCGVRVTGEATAIASGGVAGMASYSYLWSSGESGSGISHTATALPSGRQWVVASDGQCVSDTAFFDVGETPDIMLASTTLVAEPRCINDCNAAISADGAGGSAPYTFRWLDDNSTGADRSSLCAGVYLVEITDGLGCVSIDSIEITNPDTLIVSINPLTTIDLACGGGTGQIGVAAIGGRDGGYTYSWDNSSSTAVIADDLSEGMYTVTVSDSGGCAATASYTLSRPAELVVTLAPALQPDCYGGQVCYSIESATGGLGNSYRYSVDLGPLLPIDSCTMLFADNYLISVFDSSGRCSIDTVVSIVQPAEVIVDAGPDIDIDLGQETDPISISINAPNGVDTIMWSPQAEVNCLNMDCQTITSAPVSNVTLSVMVRDNNGCMGQDELSIAVNTARRVAFPNIFRPSSSTNDMFQIGVGNGVETINYLKIYNRYGQLMWSREDYLPQDIRIGGWDGSFRGQPAGNGVYTVLASISFTDGQTITYTRSLTLIN